VLAGTVLPPPLTVTVCADSGGLAPEGAVTVRAHGVAARTPPAAIITVKVATPPAGTEPGKTETPATAEIRNCAAAVIPLHVTAACAAPAGVRPGMRTWKLTEVVPEAGAGLVVVGPAVTITVPDGCCVSVAVQEAVLPGANPATVAETMTEVDLTAVAGTGTTDGETVTVPIVSAATLAAVRSDRAVRMAAVATTRALHPRTLEFIAHCGAVGAYVPPQPASA